LPSRREAKYEATEIYLHKRSEVDCAPELRVAPARPFGFTGHWIFSVGSSVFEMKVITTLCLVLCWAGLITAQIVKPESRPSPPPFKVVAQPDAPVHVVSADVKWALPDSERGVEVYIVVENVSQKTVRAYTTRREVARDHWVCAGPPGRLPAAGLLPGAQAGTSTWQGVPSADSPPGVWVDFVEFADGTRWGTDECKSGDRIDGGYAGLRAQRDQFLKIFREEGAEALMTFIRQNYQKKIDGAAWKQGERPLVPIWPPTGHSQNWEDGFTSSARGLVERVIEAEQKWGLDEIEHELSRLIGPTE
jgi:hypothetical protein